MPSDIRMSWWILNRLFFICIRLLWLMSFTRKGRSWMVLHPERSSARGKKKKKSRQPFLMRNLFFHSPAFLLTCKHQKLDAGWDHVSDLNLNVTIWVNNFADFQIGSGLNSPGVQWPNVRKQNTPQILDNLWCNSSAIKKATRWKKKMTISLHLRQD